DRDRMGVLGRAAEWDLCGQLGSRGDRGAVRDHHVPHHFSGRVATLTVGSGWQRYVLRGATAAEAVRPAVMSSWASASASRRVAGTSVVPGAGDICAVLVELERHRLYRGRRLLIDTLQQERPLLGVRH